MSPHYLEWLLIKKMFVYIRHERYKRRVFVKTTLKHCALVNCKHYKMHNDRWCVCIYGVYLYSYVLKPPEHSLGINIETI